MKQKPVRMLLAGAGFMGQVHLEAARKLVSARYAGVADVNKESARELAAKYGLKWFADPAEAIEVVKPDAVDLCVPTPFHRPLIEVCAKHGVPVLCEKPIALTKSDACAIKTIAAKTGIRIMIAQVLRFWPEYVFTVAAARRGLLGRIKSVECRRLSPPPGWNSWMMRPETGGGAVLDLQIHDMDFVLQLLGRPAAICSRGFLFKGAFNAVSSRLEYSSGVIAEVKASFLMPPSYPFRMAFLVEFEKGVIEMDSWRPKGERLKIYPARGKMHIPNLMPEERRDKAVPPYHRNKEKITHERETIRKPDLVKNDPYAAEIDYFVRCLRSGKPFARVPLNESIAALGFCLASKTSCASEMKVSLKKR